MYKIKLSNSDEYCSIDCTSPKQLEQNLNSMHDYEKYFFSLYRCFPYDDNDFIKRRNLIREKFPDLVIAFGDYYILTGQAASEVLTTFYYSHTLIDEYDDALKNYFWKRYNSTKEKHQNSQSLPFPINLTEGQLGTDEDIEIFFKQSLISYSITVSLIK